MTLCIFIFIKTHFRNRNSHFILHISLSFITQRKDLAKVDFALYNTTIVQHYVCTTLPVYNTTIVQNYLLTTQPVYKKPVKECLSKFTCDIKVKMDIHKTAHAFMTSFALRRSSRFINHDSWYQNADCLRRCPSSTGGCGGRLQAYF